MKLKRFIAVFLACVLLILLCSCEGGGVSVAAPEEGAVHITFLDVGQADCALIRTADTVIVVDTGASASNGAELVSYLRRAGIERIDLLILSHPHEDHIGGAPALLREFDVAACLMPDLLEDSAVFRETVAALGDEGCEVTRAVADVVIEQGDLTVEVLSPTKEFYSTVNDACAVVRVRFGAFSALFTGDISETVEKELIELYGDDLKADILKVAHHGSSSSTSAAFLFAVMPQYAAISCAAGNEYGFPHIEVLARLASVGTEVYRTDTEGTVTFSVEDNGLSVTKKD